MHYCLFMHKSFIEARQPHCGNTLLVVCPSCLYVSCSFILSVVVRCLVAHLQNLALALACTVLQMYHPKCWVINFSVSTNVLCSDYIVSFWVFEWSFVARSVKYFCLISTLKNTIQFQVFQCLNIFVPLVIFQF